MNIEQTLSKIKTLQNSVSSFLPKIREKIISIWPNSDNPYQIVDIKNLIDYSNIDLNFKDASVFSFIIKWVNKEWVDKNIQQVLWKFGNKSKKEKLTFPELYIFTIYSLYNIYKTSNKKVEFNKELLKTILTKINYWNNNFLINQLFANLKKLDFIKKIELGKKIDWQNVYIVCMYILIDTWITDNIFIRSFSLYKKQDDITNLSIEYSKNILVYFDKFKIKEKIWNEYIYFPLFNLLKLLNDDEVSIKSINEKKIIFNLLHYMYLTKFKVKYLSNTNKYPIITFNKDTNTLTISPYLFIKWEKIDSDDNTIIDSLSDTSFNHNSILKLVVDWIKPEEFIISLEKDKIVFNIKNFQCTYSVWKQWITIIDNRNNKSKVVIKDFKFNFSKIKTKVNSKTNLWDVIYWYIVDIWLLYFSMILFIENKVEE